MHFSGTVYKKTVRLLAFDHILILHCYYICIFMAIVKLGLKKNNKNPKLDYQNRQKYSYKLKRKQY